VIRLLFEKYIGSLFNKAQNREERRFQATKRDGREGAAAFRRAIAALKQAQAPGEDGVAVVDREGRAEAAGRYLADHRRGL